MKKILLFLVALFVATKAFAYEAQIDGIYYNFDHENKTATVTNDGDDDDDNGLCFWFFWVFCLVLFWVVGGW